MTPVCHMALSQVYQYGLTHNTGELADYIPELARVEPDRFGLALMTTKGRLYAVGDVDEPFTIQSVSKAFSYCLALERVGADAARARVGVEPSGDAFNAIEFDPVSRRPFNPMVNAGAITVAATLANMGENPITKAEVFDLSAVRNTLAVMFSCGMYDYSGSWIYDVGIPSKSGVGGGVIGVVNRQLGIGSFSPRLDEKGNSTRGVAAMKGLADELGLHVFDCTNTGSSFVEQLIR